MNKAPDFTTTDALQRKIREIKLIAFDFDGVFTDNMVYVSQNGEETVRCSRADGLGLQALRNAGVAVVIISTETNPVVKIRSQKLKTECYHGVEDKLLLLCQLAEKMGISLEQVAFVGNDINDLGCLKKVGLPVVVQDAHPDVVSWGSYRTHTPGGYGAVREVCDLIIKIQQTP